jgi:glycosyltransferase involved in cell wall biosynthesis
VKFNPKISIVIPVYNGSNYLREAIDSALAQTYKNLEVIVVNDGSNDGGKTEDIAKSYGNRIRYFYKENGGVSTALNLGIRYMTGEWFAWLSHDDLFMPDKIEKQVEFLEQNRELNIIQCNFEIIDESGGVYGKYINSTTTVIKNGRDVLENWIYGCALLINKACFETVGLFNVENETTQDVEMWLRLVRHYPIVIQQDVLCKCRKHPESTSVKDLKVHNFYRTYLFEIILSEFDISFFYKESEIGIDSRRLRSKTYNWLGDNALNRGAHEGARLCYRRAYETYPSLINQALYKILIGMRMWSHVMHATMKTKRLASSVIKRIINK